MMEAILIWMCKALLLFAAGMAILAVAVLILLFFFGAIMSVLQGH